MASHIVRVEDRPDLEQQIERPGEPPKPGTKTRSTPWPFTSHAPEVTTPGSSGTWPLRAGTHWKDGQTVRPPGS